MGIFNKQQQQQSVESAWSSARREMRALGLKFQAKPEGEMPVLSQDLGELSDGAFMTLWQQFVEWTNYIATQVTKTEVDEDDAEAALKVAEAKYTVRHTEKGQPGIQRARQERELDEEVQRLAFDLRRRRALRKMISTLMTNTERSSSLISRDLSRRIGLAGPLNRSGGFKP